MDDFKECLNDIWFNMYGRSYQERKRRIEDSSAFEHIFVGESRDGEILGFHNWLRFYQLERNGLIDYRGYYVSQCTKTPDRNFKSAQIRPRKRRITCINHY